jgi:hypothetical protein
LNCGTIGDSAKLREEIMLPSFANFGVELNFDLRVLFEPRS